MKQNTFTAALRILTLAVLLLIMTVCHVTAGAEEMTVPNVQAGMWCFVYYPEDIDSEDPVDLAYLFLEQDGSLTLCVPGDDGEYRYTSSGTWSTQLITDSQSVYCYADRLVLTFTQTTNPQYIGSDYHVECVWYVFSESWISYDCRKTAMVIQERECTGTSPFAELCEEEDAGQFYMTEWPNMQVANCQSYVSLREEPSTKSARLIKVPLGAQVFVFPEGTEENGFLRCAYHDHEGYILA